ncbi:MAG: hypothetical protein U1F71_01565 [Verrucomicrobiaceae bacterium]
MWKCSICDAEVEDDSWEQCWQCTSPRDVNPEAVKSLRDAHQVRLQAADPTPNSERIQLSPQSRAMILGLIGAAIGMIGLSFEKAAAEKNLAMLHALTAADVVSITVSDQHHVAILSTTDSTALTGFVAIANGIERHSPDHPQYKTTFDIDLYLTNGGKHHFECRTKKRSNQTIDINFNGTSCSSSTLLAWLRNHAPSLLKDQ